MLLTKREEQLLKAFLDVGKLSLKEMSDFLQVSSRTVYRTLSDLTNSLSSQEISILKDGKKYYLSGNLENISEIAVLDEFTQEERLINIVYRLLTSQESVTNESLQEDLKVSNVTIIQDIAQIEKRLLDFDLTLDRQKGYKLLGSVDNRRRLLALLLTNGIAVSDFTHCIYQPFTILETEKTEIAKKVFEETSIAGQDIDAKMKMFFIVLLSLAGNETNLPSRSNVSKQALEISQGIFQEFAKRTKTLYSIQEIIFYASMLDELIIRRQENPLFTEKFDGEFFYNISNLIDTVSLYTKIDFFKDKVLFKFLFHHIRLNLGIPILFPDNALPKMVQLLVEKNEFLHRVVSLLVQDIFPKYLQNNYEYGMITLHFIASLRRSPDIYPVRMLLITDERRLTRELLITKIKSVAPFVEWIDIQSPADYLGIETEQYDYLLATKPLANQQIDVISSFPSVKELLDLQEKLQKVQENRTIVVRNELVTDQGYDLQKYLLASSHLLKQFSLYSLDKPSDFTNMVQKVIARQENIQNKAYLVEKLLSRFSMSPMAIPNTGLVLLHTQSSQIQQSSFTIFELETPIQAVSMKHEKELVSRCLLMLTSKNATEEMRDLMVAISQSIIENHLYTEIYKTGTESIIYQLLNTIFNEKIKKLEN